MTLCGQVTMMLLAAVFCSLAVVVQSNKNCTANYDVDTATSRNCTDHFRNTDLSFQELNRTIADKLTEPDLLIYILLQLQDFMTPCVGTAEALLRLFVNKNVNSDDITHEWRENMKPIGKQVYRTVHHELSHNEYFREHLHNLTVRLGPASPMCIDWLINKYSTEVGDYFRNKYPNFQASARNQHYGHHDHDTSNQHHHHTHSTRPHHHHTPDPHHHTPDPHHTMSASHTQSPALVHTATTTSELQTSAAAAASTATITSTTTIVTSTVSVTSTATPLRCVVCSGLDCLLRTPDQLTQLCDGGLCMIHLLDSHQGGRTIARSCGSRDSCQKIQNNSAQCQRVDTDLPDWNTECYFCCDQDTCNTPPLIVPDTGLWNPYSGH